MSLLLILIFVNSILILKILKYTERLTTDENTSNKAICLLWIVRNMNTEAFIQKSKNGGNPLRIKKTILLRIVCPCLKSSTLKKDKKNKNKNSSTY